MKSVFLLLLLAPFAAWTQAELKPFKLKGVLKELPDSAKASKFYLLYPLNGKLVKDSAEVKNGKFTFTGKLLEPVEADLMAVAGVQGTKLAEEYTYLVYMIYIEPGNQKVIARKQLHTTAFTAKSSKTNTEYIGLHRRDEAYHRKYVQPFYDGILEARKKQDTETELRLQQSADSAVAIGKEEVYRHFIEQNPGSPVALYAWQRYTKRSPDQARDEELFNRLSDKIRQTERGKMLAAKLEEGKITGIGKQAPGFTQNDTLDRAVSLSSFYGNYVLLDFWASWCVPCRLENPNLVKANQAYRNYNFRIISISLDRLNDRDKWISAIRSDKLNWTHLSDLQYWNNAVAKEYGIDAIPQNLLIDPQGKIIAKNLRGVELEKVLAKLFAPKKAF